MTVPTKGVFQPERLRLIRSAQGMTQAALADTLGVSRQYMQQIEKGVKAPNRESVLALSEILGVGEQFFDRPVRH
ncbi:MAG: helix-turn-helix transcriptional regulator, partial [Gammaproteobacteria bacterium]|nr:helix-turn-helix transcriptional regulator [Gammaproteobacteria bacterium]